MLRIKKIIIPICCLVALIGCGRQEEEKVADLPERGEFMEVEPFLAPVVEKVTGKEEVKGEEAIIRDLIIRYNRVLVTIKINLDNIPSIKGLVTRREATKVRGLVEEDRTEERIMSCTLRELKFNNIFIEGDTGKVETSEEWFFEDRALKTGAVMAPLKNFRYDVAYKVVKIGEKWLVDRLEIKRVSEFFPPKGVPKRVKIKRKERW